MKTTKTPNILNDICLVSRQGVCLLDMRQVANAAKQLGLSNLAETIESDLNQNNVVNGQYFTTVKVLFGA